MFKRRRTHPLVVEVLSYEESDALMREWFESVVFVDGPEEELPELDPEEGDEPRD